MQIPEDLVIPFVNSLVKSFINTWIKAKVTKEYAQDAQKWYTDKKHTLVLYPVGDYALLNALHLSLCIMAIMSLNPYRNSLIM